ncbi:DUF1049 domain-containing protein [Gordonia amarae]|nr:lipopolysaccharide assembly protein LapA domain-containing protein [Gordonia amarae]QHN30621.1 DUF1049 domain-containing protein [Gordonia amarae]
MTTPEPQHEGRRPVPQDQFDLPDIPQPGNSGTGYLPTEDQPGTPAPDPGVPAPPVEDAARRGRRSGKSIAGEVRHTRTSAAWAGMIIGSILAILLLVFIVQNLSSQKIWLLFWEVNLPVGVSLLIAAIAGALVTALICGLRMFQLNRALTKASKANR